MALPTTQLHRWLGMTKETMNSELTMDNTKGFSVNSAFVVVVMVISLPLVFKWLNLAFGIMTDDSLEHVLFREGNTRYNFLSGVWLVTGGLGTLLGGTILLTRSLNQDGSAIEPLLVNLTTLLLGIGFLAFMIHQGIYNSSGAHIGSPLMSVQTGSAFCAAGLYCVYRLQIEKFADNAAGGDRTSLGYRLYLYQVAYLALIPLIFRTSYGVWYGLFGTAGEGSLALQFLMTFVLFFVPMFMIYLYITNKDRFFGFLPEGSQPVFGILGILAMLFGTYSYLTIGLEVDLY